MSKNIKKAIVALAIIVVVIIVTISTFFIVRNIKEKKQIDNVCETYTDNNIQDNLQKNDNVKIDDLMVELNGEDVIGVIKIEKIGFEGLVYEGTTMKTLDKGVGHFENSSYLEGNVCLAAHNSNKFWAKLHTLQKGDIISYTSFLGAKQYKVSNIGQISATDWSSLENTDDNIITLITCVKGKPDLRLCVQASEIK